MPIIRDYNQAPQDTLSTADYGRGPVLGGVADTMNWSPAEQWGVGSPTDANGDPAQEQPRLFFPEAQDVPTHFVTYENFCAQHEYGKTSHVIMLAETEEGRSNKAVMGLNEKLRREF